MDQRIGQLRCGGCDSVFNKQSSLSRHEKIHWAALRCARDACEKGFSSHKHLSKHLTRHSDTNLVVRIVPFNIRTKIEVKQELNDDECIGGSLSVRRIIIKKEDEEGEFKMKVDVKDEPIEKCNVQLCKRVKKEENDEDETWDGDECDCDECRVERMIKLELDQTGEKEIDQNNGQADRGCVKIKNEEEEEEDAGSVNIEVKRPNKKQRIDKMTDENDSIGTPTFLRNVQSSNEAELEDDRVDKIDETDDENEDEQDRGELFANWQIDNGELNVNNIEDDHDDDTEVDEEYDENYEESGDELSENEQMDYDVDDEDYEETEIDEESEQNEGEQKHSNVISNNHRNVSNRQLVQLSPKNFVKRIEPDELGNRFECDYEDCGRRCKLRCNLIKHIRRHSGEKPFKCSWDNCYRAFYRKDSLEGHLNTHTGDTPFVCTWSGCNARFRQRANLSIHRRMHFNDRKHRCDWPGCVQDFVHSSNLKRHRLGHTGERPHKCDWPGCVQAFTDQSSLKVHRRIHTKERPFNCSQCGAAFTQKTNLNAHYRCNH